MHQFLGIIVGIIFFISYLPQLKQLYKTDDIKGVSTIFWLFVSLATFITFDNLYNSNSAWFVVIPQALNAFIALIILAWVVVKKYGPKQLMFIYAFSATLYFLVTISMISHNDYLQNIATILMILAYLIQLVKLIRRKNTNGLSVRLFIGVEIALGTMMFNILTTGAPYLSAITELANLIMVSLVIIFILKYRKEAF